MDDATLVAYTNEALRLAGLRVHVASPEAALGVLSRTSVLVAATERLLGGGQIAGIQRRPRDALARSHNFDVLVRELAFDGLAVESVDGTAAAEGHREECTALLAAVIGLARARNNDASPPARRRAAAAPLRDALAEVGNVLSRLDNAQLTATEEHTTRTAPPPPRVPRPRPPTPESTFVSAEARDAAAARAARVAAARTVYSFVPPPASPTPPVYVSRQRPVSQNGRRRSLLSMLPYRTHGVSPGPGAYPHHTALPPQQRHIRTMPEEEDAAPHQHLPPDLAVHLARLTKLQLAEHARRIEKQHRLEVATAAAQADVTRRAEERKRLLREHLNAVDRANDIAASKAAAAAEHNAAAAARAAAARDAAAREGSTWGSMQGGLARDRERRFREQFLIAVARERQRVLDARHDDVSEYARIAADLAWQRQRVLDAEDDSWHALLDRVAAAQRAVEAQRAAERDMEHETRRQERLASMGVAAQAVA